MMALHSARGALPQRCREKEDPHSKEVLGYYHINATSKSRFIEVISLADALKRAIEALHTASGGLRPHGTEEALIASGDLSCMHTC